MLRTHDEDYEDLLKDAQADPKGVAAQDLLKKVLPFLNISGTRRHRDAAGRQPAAGVPPRRHRSEGAKGVGAS